jgi:hypothetical protein
MHISSIKSSEFSADVIKRCDVTVCHVPHHHPTPKFGAGASLPETAGLDVDRLAARIDLDNMPTIAEIVSGKVTDRTDNVEITCFLNILGLGFQFAAVDSVLYKKAKKRNAGNKIPTDWLTQLEIRSAMVGFFDRIKAQSYAANEDF